MLILNIKAQKHACFHVTFIHHYGKGSIPPQLYTCHSTKFCVAAHQVLELISYGAEGV